MAFLPYLTNLKNPQLLILKRSMIENFVDLKLNNNF